MKMLFVTCMLFMLCLSGCTDRVVSVEFLERYDSYCTSNGGIREYELIFGENGPRMWSIRCNDGAVFYVYKLEKQS